MTDIRYWMQLAAAQTVLLSDKKAPYSFDALYIPGLSEGMVDSGDLLGHLAQLYKLCGRPMIAFNGSNGERFSHNEEGDQDRPVGKDPGAGWSGAEDYLEGLTFLGVSPKDLVLTGPGYHTRHEMAQLVLVAQQNVWKRVGIVTVPWHYSTVFTMLVDAMRKSGYFIAAYALPPLHTAWNHDMLGSQGIEQTTPMHEVSSYFPKLAGYQRAGRACSFEDLFDYLDRRETIMWDGMR